jgi:two-component system phosphate regulon sensor histidine kinase PhoR
MAERSPTLTAVVLLLLGVVAVWIVVTMPRVSVVAGLAATGLIVWLWWLLHRDAQEQRSVRAGLEDRLRELARAAGEPGARPDRAAEVVRLALAAAGDDARACRAVLDSVDQPVLALDRNGSVVGANRQALALLAPGSAGVLLGEPLAQLLPDSRALAVLGRARAGEAGRAQAKLLTSEGPRIVEVSAEPVEGGPFTIDRPPAVVVTLRDVTEQATALQLKTDFVANASHELRTPLASIRTAAETLRELAGDPGGGDARVRERLVGMIAGNAERLEELSRDLLDLSSLESPEAEATIERVDLCDLAADLRELFQDACAQRGVSLELELDGRLGSAWTDARLVRLVLRNLIDNAIKFAYEGTAVRVRGSVLATWRGADGSRRYDARLEVIDKGMGIPLAQQQRIFERFYQADAARTGSSRRRGTGLGLAIVKHALRALGGTIRVESVWQQGTTMTVELPGCVGSGGSGASD